MSDRRTLRPGGRPVAVRPGGSVTARFGGGSVTARPGGGSVLAGHFSLGPPALCAAAAVAR